MQIDSATNIIKVKWVPKQENAVPHRYIKQMLKSTFALDLADVVIIAPQHWWNLRSKVYVKKNYDPKSRTYQQIK